VPSPQTILEGLTAIANEARWLAIAWHLLLAAMLIGLLLGWRPPTRRLGPLLAMPLLSVSALAWTTANPFNGAIFTLFAVALIGIALQSSLPRVRMASPALATAGALLIAFGWCYPHFLETTAWTAYLYAAPFGLVPCPTLSVVIGLTLLLDHLGSRAWSVVLSLAGLFYGVVGVFRLGVALDYALLAGAAVLLLAALMMRTSRSVAASS
jgi:hypothetical protein